MLLALRIAGFGRHFYSVYVQFWVAEASSVTEKHEKEIDKTKFLILGFLHSSLPL